MKRKKRVMQKVRLPDGDPFFGADGRSSRHGNRLRAKARGAKPEAAETVRRRFGRGIDARSAR